MSEKWDIVLDAIDNLATTPDVDAALQRDLENLSKPGRPGWERYYFPGWPDANYRLHFFLPAVADQE